MNTNLTRTASRIRCLPAAHRQLTARLADTNPLHPDAGHCHTQPRSVVPLNLETDAIARDIAYSLTLAGEITADLVRVPEPTTLRGRADLTASRITTLAGLPWIACHPQPCFEPIEVLSGLDIIDHLDQLYRLARTALGLPSEERQLIDTWRDIKSHA